MKPINKSGGSTPSEQYLSKLADATFLDLWSYPNTFTNRGQKNGGDGKELCDLLVVCGDDVIIFSDKSISWPGGDVEVAWSRWYRRAVKKSVDQIKGAARWINEHPDRIFLDPKCVEEFPIPLPPADRMRVHGIAIALGAQTACSEHVGDVDGSMMIVPSIRGDDHVNPEVPGRMPFAFGDVDPGGPFVHVFDETGLNIVLREMDTISDFVEYLRERALMMRSQTLTIAPNEADLVALYLATEDDDGNHHFPKPDTVLEYGSFKFAVEPGYYIDFVSDPQYRARLSANEDSYIWDRLITTFTKHVLAGTSVGIGGEAPTTVLAEVPLRMMARENRTSRRALGGAIKSGLELAKASGQDRYARVLMPGKGFADPEAGYVVMALKYKDYLDDKGGYQRYREVRAAMLQTYCSAFLYNHREFKRMVGVALDMPGAGEGGSEDLIAVEIDEWTPELEASVEAAREHYEILKPGNQTRSGVSIREFPDIRQPMSRQQRRASERAARKRKR